MHRAHVVLALSCMAIVAVGAAADSPLTSTRFASAYEDYGIVREAIESGVLTDALAEYLADEENPLDVKAAVVNGLGWDIDGKRNAALFAEYCLPDAEEGLDPADLTGSEAFVLGYLVAMDDYNAPEDALPFLERARGELSESFTVAMVHALVQAQAGFEETDDWPNLWAMVASVVEDESLNGDMRLGALRVITEYMVLYAEE